MPETTPAKLQYGGLGEYLPYKATLKILFDAVCAYTNPRTGTKLLDCPADMTVEDFWAQTCSDPNRFNTFMYEAENLISLGFLSLEGTDLTKATTAKR